MRALFVAPRKSGPHRLPSPAQRERGTREFDGLEWRTTRPTFREGSLDAPTRHALDWKNPEFYDQAAIDKELHRVFDICHGCRRCVSLCQAFPTLFDLVDESSTMEVDGVAHGRLREGRRSVLSVRPVLPDQMPVRAAASVERRFSAPDAAREGREPQARRDEARLARCCRDTTTVGKIATIPLVVNVVNATNRSNRRASCSTRRSACIRTRACRRSMRRTARRRLKHLDDGAASSNAGRTHARQGRALRHLLLQQLASAIGRGSRRGAQAQRHRGASSSSAKSAAACRSSNSAIWTASQSTRRQNIPVLAAAVRDGWDITRGDSVVRADVPPGTAADVSGRRRRAARQAPHLRSVRISVAAPSGAAAEDRVRERARQGRLARAVPSARAEHRTEDARRARARARHRSHRDRALLGPRRHLRRQDRDVCDRAQDRQARSRAACSRSSPRSLRQRLSDGGIHLAHGMGDKPAAESPISLLRYAYGI